MTDLTRCWCPHCHADIALQVIHAESNTRKGWYCPCGFWLPALGRERIMEPRMADAREGVVEASIPRPGAQSASQRD